MQLSRKQKQAALYSLELICSKVEATQRQDSNGNAPWQRYTLKDGATLVELGLALTWYLEVSPSNAQRTTWFWRTNLGLIPAKYVLQPFEPLLKDRDGFEEEGKGFR